MAWKKLNTPDILSVKYYPATQILKARLKSGQYEIYKQITETRYQELLAGGHPHDIDTFFSNIIRPSRISTRKSLRWKIYRFARVLLTVAAVIAILALLGLWNSGLLDTYLAKIMSVKQ